MTFRALWGLKVEYFKRVECRVSCISSQSSLVLSRARSRPHAPHRALPNTPCPARAGSPRPVRRGVNASQNLHRTGTCGPCAQSAMGSERDPRRPPPQRAGYPSIPARGPPVCAVRAAGRAAGRAGEFPSRYLTEPEPTHSLQTTTENWNSQLRLYKVGIK